MKNVLFFSHFTEEKIEAPRDLATCKTGLKGFPSSRFRSICRQSGYRVSMTNHNF